MTEEPIEDPIGRILDRVMLIERDTQDQVQIGMHENLRHRHRGLSVNSC